MHEPLLERIRVLEWAVQRWRRVSLALALMVVSLLAIIGTFGLLYLFNERDLRAQEMEARMQAERAQLEAQRALQAADEARLKLLQEHVDGALKNVR